MTFYSEMADIALELLTEYGKAITLTRTTGGSVDPVTGEIVAGVSDDQETVGVVRNYNDSLVDGALIKATDKEAVLSASVEPLQTDTIDGMQVVAIKTINPAGTVVAYKVQLRA